MELTKIQYNGCNYLIRHLYTNNYHGKKCAYHILTNNQKWCGSLMPELCGHPNTQSKEEYDVNCKKNPSMFTARQPYYTVEFIEDSRYEEQDDLKDFIKDFPVDTDSYYEFIYNEPYVKYL